MTFLLPILKYWRVIGLVLALTGAGGFFLHYQALRADRAALRAENAVIQGRYEANLQELEQTLLDHEQTLQVLAQERADKEALEGELQDIRDEALAQEDGPLAGNMWALFRRLRGTQDGN